MPRSKAEKRPLRRVPTQERSRRRLENILHAAATAFADQGFDAAKMEAIAQEAGTSIGSVYQFFANKRALFRAVAERCLERSREAFAERLLKDTSQRPWDELVDDVVETFAALHRKDASFRALVSNVQLYEEFAEADRALLEEFVRGTSMLMGQRAPLIPEARRNIVAQTVVHAIAGLLLAASRLGPDTFEPMLAEIKLLVLRYLEPEIREMQALGAAIEADAKLAT